LKDLDFLPGNNFCRRLRVVQKLMLDFTTVALLFVRESCGLAKGVGHPRAPDKKRGYKMGSVKSVCFALVCAVGLILGTHLTAYAAVVAPTDTGGASDPLPGDIEANDGYSQWAFWSPSFTPQDNATVEANLDAAFFPTDVSGVVKLGSGFPDEQTSFSYGPSTTGYSVWGFHFGCGDLGQGACFLAILYPVAQFAFSITGLPGGLSNAFAANPSVIPLPPALVLFGTALVGMTMLARRRKAAA
jgi:hypothetical protein